MMQENFFGSNNQLLDVKSDSSDVILHENILDILFKHKEETYKKLINIKGTFLIDHIAIKIIDPSNRMMIFSISPSVEYNLLVHGLWKHDKSFSLKFHQNKNFYLWDEAYTKEYSTEIKQVKQFEHGFTLGFNICKQIDKLTLIYSFATRSKNQKLFEYYANYLSELNNLGNYGYKLIRNIYERYADHAPDTNATINNQTITKKPYLRLLINNDENLT